jgi:collagenase-like PrtC family protease
MQFAVGYQLMGEGLERFPAIVRDYREHIAEVYFPWVHGPSGRASLSESRGLTDWTAQATLERDLRTFRDLGLKLDLLLNANCYGGKAVSRHLENQVGSLLAHLEDSVGGVDAVTTSSLAVARTVKRHFPKVDVRASVNLRIGTAQAMQFVAGLFDSFCVQRDIQRHLATLRRLRTWADAQGKRLCLLVNSGCLRHCPGQVFHDNLVAHEVEVDETANIPDWTPHVCWNLYRQRSHWPAVLQATWIRPEDVDRYQGLADTLKLATRMHANPRLVIHAYAHRRYRGNLLDLFEPGFGPAFAPFIVDSSRLPADWFERTSTCDAECTVCTYCAAALQEALVNADPEMDGGASERAATAAHGSRQNGEHDP